MSALLLVALRWLQISMLKAKVAELTGKLHDGKASAKPPRAGGSTQPNRRVAAPTIEERNIRAVKALDFERRKELETACEDRDAARAQYTALKGKYDGVRARNSTLARDAKASKDKVAAAARQAEADENQIRSLEAQLIRAAKNHMTADKEARDKTDQMLASLKPTSTMEFKRLTALCQQQQARIGSLEKRAGGALEQQDTLTLLCQQQQLKINSLHTHLAEAKAQAQNAAQGASTTTAVSRQRTPLQPPSSHRPSSASRPKSATLLVKQQQAKIQELEKRIVQLSQSEARASRPSSRASSASRPSSRVHRPKSVPSSSTGQTADAALVHEQAVLLRAAEVEREKMQELVDVLKEKLEELEVQDGRASPAKDLNPPQNLEDALGKLELQQDENKALRMSLRETISAKEQEIKLLHQMMKQTRKVFSEGLRQFKTKAAGTNAASSMPRNGPPPRYLLHPACSWSCASCLLCFAVSVHVSAFGSCISAGQPPHAYTTNHLLPRTSASYASYTIVGCIASQSNQASVWPRSIFLKFCLWLPRRTGHV